MPEKEKKTESIIELTHPSYETEEPVERVIIKTKPNQRTNLFEQIHGMVDVRVGEVDAVEGREFGGVRELCLCALFSHVGMKEEEE